MSINHRVETTQRSLNIHLQTREPKMPPKTQLSSVWLEFSVGDKSAYDQQVADYQRAVDFLSKVGSNYGYTTKDVEALTPDEKETLREIYTNNPDWKNK